jgi:hypothetical protein
MTDCYHPQIVTSSIEEGLDYAASLLCDAITDQAHAHPVTSLGLASSLALYVRLRYVGELGLAFKELVGMAADCKAVYVPSPLFSDQVNWLAKKLGYPLPY